MSQRSLLTRLLSCWGPSPRPPDTSPGVVDAASTVYMDAAALLHDHLTKRDGQLGPEHLSQEFGSLGNGLPESAKTTSVANGEQNKRKNRYTNVLPFDYNRVKLKEVDPETDYINASLVAWNSTAVTGVPGEVPCKYVATQGPLNCTIPDFWTMIIQNGLTSIVMLTRTMECRSQRCAQYFPEEPGATVEHGNYIITTLSLQELNADISMRQLMVTRKATNGNQAEPEQHLITHYHYHLWPDHGVPSSVTPLRELSFNLWQQGSKAVAVHCSAGIGRTGTFIAADSLLRRMWALAGSGTRVDKATLKRALDVPSVVCELRMMRSGMVQTAEQYGLLYEIVLNEALARTEALTKAGNSSNPSVHNQKRARAYSTSVQPSGAVSTAQPRRWSQAQVADGGSSSSLARSHTGTPRTSLSIGLEALQGASSEQSENISSSRLPSTTLQDWDTSRAGREKRTLSRLPSATLQGWDQSGLDTRNIARLPSASLQGWESQIMRLASQSASRPKSVLDKERRELGVAVATSPKAQERAAAVARQHSGGTTSGGLDRMNSWQLQQTNAPWGA